MGKTNSIFASLVLAGGLLASQSASADYWFFTDANSVGCPSGCDTWDHTRTYQSNTGLNAQLSAYAAYGNRTTSGSADSIGDVEAFADAEMIDFSSSTGNLGVSRNYGGSHEPGTSGQHAFDNALWNNNQAGAGDSTDKQHNFEFVLLDAGHGNIVALSDIYLGWWSNDWDVQVFAYETMAGGINGNGGWNENIDLTGVDPNSLAAAGWDYAETITDDNFVDSNGYKTADFNADGKKSRYWLIGTAMNKYAGYADKFKLSAVKYSGMKCCTPPGGGGGEAPSPAPLALIGGILGLMGMHRKFRTRR